MRDRSHTDGERMKKIKKTKQEKAFFWRGVLIVAAAMLIALGLQIAGILIGKGREIPGVGAVLTICCVLPPILLAVSVVLGWRYTKKLEKPRLEELNRMILSEREVALQASEQSVAVLRRLRRAADAYAVLIGSLGLLIALCSGLRFNSAGSGVPLFFYAAYLLIAALSRIRVRIPTAFMDDEDSLYVAREDFPKLYALVEKAAAEMGCGKPVRIALLNDGNVGVLDYGGVVSLQIGVYLLNLLSDREMYAVALHEFSHITGSAERTEDFFNIWLNYGQIPTFLSGLTNLLFFYPNAVIDFRYAIYQLATSAIHEAEADRAMLRVGDSEIAASALIKTYYYDRFESEEQTYDAPGDFESGQILPDLASRRFAQFRERIDLRSEVWDGLIFSELPALHPTHPTLKMRLEAFGITEPRTLPDSSPPDYAAERARALAYLDAQIVDQIGPDYPQLREERYLTPLRTVEQWEAEGRPLTAEKYRDVVMSLHMLGRSSDAEALCERAIAGLPDAAAMFAYYEKGRLLLRRYDRAGLAYLYRAVEGNKNFIDDGLDEIGEFCRMTGDEAELEHLRQLSMELGQKQIDEYDEISRLNKGDRLSAEQLPDGVLEDILAHIRSFEAGSIDKIYLVRKTISPELFTSAFVIRFGKDCDPEQRDEVIHQIFCYLDTVSDWQYSLFDYDSVKRAGVESIPESLVYQKA